MSTNLHVVVPSRLAPGYRLAGAAVDEAESAGDARAVVGRLLEQRESGVIAVHEPFLETLPADWRAKLAPLLVALPEGARPGEAGQRRARLKAMLEEAIGYHFVFGEEAR